MRRLVLVAALALVACDSAESGPKSVDEVKAEARQMERPEPGQYRQTTRITRFDIPGAPPQMVAQIRQAMEGQNNNVTYCLTKADTEKGFEEVFKKGREGECSYERFDASANDIDAVMVCKGGPGGGSARMTMAGTVGKTGSKVNVDIAQKDGTTAMGDAMIAMELTTTRVGDCPPGQAR